MPVHRTTLIAQHDLEQAEALLASTIEDLRADILERDLDDALARLKQVQERAAKLEETLLRVRR